MDVTLNNITEVLSHLMHQKPTTAGSGKSTDSNAIKIPYAERDGNLIHISQVDSGLACGCICPVCHTPVIARKGAKRRHHFAHQPGAVCNAETVLHYIAKNLIYQKLTQALKNGSELPISWKCKFCSDRHCLNLLKDVSHIDPEKDLGECQPDLTLFNSGEMPTAIIEIVVSHPPEENVITFGNRKNIPVIIFEFHSAEDLESLELSEVFHPKQVLYCTRTRCPECNFPLFVKTLYIMNGTCWRCGSPMKIAFMTIEETVHGPEEFSENDKALVRKSGVFLKEVYSRKENKRIIANTCPSCVIYTGNKFLRYHKTLLRKLQGQITGTVCRNCGKHFSR